MHAKTEYTNLISKSLNNNKAIWKFVNQELVRNSKTDVITLRINDTGISDQTAVCSQFYRYFVNLINVNISTFSSTNATACYDITTDEIQNAISLKKY